MRRRIRGQESLIQEVETLRAKVAELTDAYVRLRADFDNYRRRTRQEMETIGDEANAKLIEKLLPVIDDLDRALLAGADSPDRGLYSGVELVQRKLTDILCQEGLQPVPGVGSPLILMSMKLLLARMPMQRELTLSLTNCVEAMCSKIAW